MGFSGFPPGTQYTPVPNPLFGPLLEAIEDSAELKCTLRAMWLLHRKKERPRFVTTGELLSDRVLLVGLTGLGVSPSEAIQRGIAGAVDRGTFISVPATRNGSQEELLFLNDQAGQRAAAMLKEGSMTLGGFSLMEGLPSYSPQKKANIFTLYEDNIGMLTPLLADEMKQAEENYPWPWIEEAFRVAVSRNKRSWRYIEATLKRWATEGKDDGEPGRYSQKTASEEELWEYLRERGRLPGP